MPNSPLTARCALAACALALAACAPLVAPSCAAGATGAVSDLLYFGTSRPGGVVSAQDWARFLADSVTPRFPQGFTAWPASGQWRSADGTVVREGSFVLSIVHPRSDAAEAAVAAIASEYKARFRQESVLRASSPVCAAF